MTRTQAFYLVFVAGSNSLPTWAKSTWACIHTRREAELVRLEHFGGVASVAGRAHLLEILQLRFGDGVNEFWASTPGRPFPVLSLALSGSWAVLHFFPEDGHPGWQSTASGELPLAAQSTVFNCNGIGEVAEFPVKSVVGAADGIAAMVEFMSRPDTRPASIDWFEL